MKNDAILPLKEKFLEYFRQLPVQRLAAASIARSEDTISLWKKDDSEFSDEIDKAAAEWAMDKAKKVKSEEWLLERIMRGHFSQRTEITGADGEPVVFEIKRE